MSETDVISFRELFDLDEIQRIQDAFALATNVASIITEPDGTPITQPSNFCDLCINIIRKTEKGLANCMKSDAALGRPNPGGPTVQPCLSGGLWDGGASISIGDRHIANWLIGQVRDESQANSVMLKYADEIGAEKKAFKKALSSVPTMPREQFEHVCQALFLLASMLSKQAFQNFQLQQTLAAQQHLIQQVISAADNVTGSSQVLSIGSESMAEGASQQAAAAEEASASMEQMVANIRQTADNAAQTEKIAVQTALGARKAGKSVNKAVKAMKKIAKKIAVIEDIAAQTRMLSLNATIEAGKAQEHGKGFAVVASEVRLLAEHSRIAAEEINELATSGVSIAKKAGENLSHLVPDIQKTAELVQEISAAGSEQNTGAIQINRAIQQLDQVIQQNALLAEDLAATAETLEQQAEQLQQTIGVFKTDDADHAATVHDNVQIIKPIQAPDDDDAGSTPHQTLPVSGRKLDLKKADEASDRLDDEFEHY